MNDKYFKMFEAVLEDMSISEDALVRFDKAMTTVREAMLTDAPLWQKFNFFVNTIGHLNDNEIDWDKVNKVLSEKLDKYDSNLYTGVAFSSKEQLLEASATIIAASCLDGDWYHVKCKECGKEFNLSYNEVQFYKRKELDIPKRCYNCRKGIKKTDNPNTVATVKPEPTVKAKTAMELAFEKAGYSE